MDDAYNKRIFLDTLINSRDIIDSLTLLSDVIMPDTAKYFRTPKATLYINTEAGTRNQVFENPIGTITAIAYFRNNQQIYVAEYYSNGQIMCQFRVTDLGVRHGTFRCYYENGKTRITGEYNHGKELPDLHKQYDSSGNVEVR